MTDNEILTHAARRLAQARGITRAAAADILRANPEALQEITAELALLDPAELAAEDGIDSPTAAPRKEAGTTSPPIAKDGP